MPAPLEAELHYLAARDPGVQLREMHQVHLGTPKPASLMAQPGSRDWQDELAHIGMAVRITWTVETNGVPAIAAPLTPMGLPLTQTLTTH